jgi:hypothetical protein
MSEDIGATGSSFKKKSSKNRDEGSIERRKNLFCKKRKNRALFKTSKESVY